MFPIEINSYNFYSVACSLLNSVVFLREITFCCCIPPLEINDCNFYSMACSLLGEEQLTGVFDSGIH